MYVQSLVLGGWCRWLVTVSGIHKGLGKEDSQQGRIGEIGLLVSVGCCLVYLSDDQNIGVRVVEGEYQAHSYLGPVAFSWLSPMHLYLTCTWLDLVGNTVIWLIGWWMMVVISDIEIVCRYYFQLDDFFGTPYLLSLAFRNSLFILIIDVHTSFS